MFLQLLVYCFIITFHTPTHSLIAKYDLVGVGGFVEKSLNYVHANFALDMAKNRTISGGSGGTTTVVNYFDAPPPVLGLTFTDLYNTLKLALVNGMNRFEVLDKEAIDILFQFYLVMQAHFPFRNENVRRYFKRMNIWWTKRPDKNQVFILNYREAARISDGFLMPISSWRHCLGSRPFYRGYPCGFWSLFHVLTVHEYYEFKNPRIPKTIYSNHHLQNNSTLAAFNKPEMKHESLASMMSFIPKFYCCDAKCSESFAKTTTNFRTQLTSPESSVLYLWRLHNQINARLAQDKFADPHFPKQQFPSKQQCPQCSDHNAIFNESRVFEFLLKFYGKQTLRYNSDN